MRTRQLLCTLGVLGLGVLGLTGPAGAQGASASPETFHVELAGMLWTPTPEVVVSSGSLATPVDFINQFGIEKTRFKEVRVVLKAGRKHKLRYSSVPLTYSGAATLTQRVTFQGQTFNVGVPTSAELKWTLMRFGYEWDAVATNMGFFGVFADVKYNKLHAQLTAPAPIGSRFYDQNVPVPTIGLIGRGYLTRFVSITGEFTGLKANTKSLNAKFYDLDLYGTANFGRNIGAQFGYRTVTVNYTVDNDTGDMKMKGPYFGGVLRF